MSDRLVAWFQEAFPIASWLPSYETAALGSDIRAGLTVGIMLIPQGMAYAVIAGVPPIYGLYASLVPLLIYPVLGTSRQLAVGPIAIDMLIIAAGVGVIAEMGSERFIGLAILLAALVGLIQIGMGVMRLGFLVSFLARPVVTGFASAAALIIAFSQLGTLLGIELGHTQYILLLLWEAGGRLGEVHALTLLIGLSTVFVLLVLDRWPTAVPGALVVVVGGTLAAYLMDLNQQGVAIVGDVPDGLPPLALPAFGFEDMRILLPTAITLALVQFMNVASLGRLYASRYKYSIDANHELVAIGASNLLGSLFRAIPISGSFSRTAVNDRAGAKSPLSNVFAAVLVGLTLLFFTPLFFYLPMAVLAAIIIVAAAGLVDIKELRYLFRAKQRDGYIALFTFFTTLLIGIQEGILLGIGASTLAVMYRYGRPNVVELGHLPGTRSFRDVERTDKAEAIQSILMMRVDASFSFINADFFKKRILERQEAQDRKIRAVIVDGMSINDLDTTAVESLEEIARELRKSDIALHLTGLIGPVRDVVRRSGLYEELGEDHFHRSPHQAVEYILKRWDKVDDEHRLEIYRADVRHQEPEAPEEKLPRFE
ncbi:MAG: sulfate permease [Bacteroidetes bacterium]|jgi:SulP family sulfate permease|nr:sulfate permease [Bacteroidota bacterium]